MPNVKKSLGNLRKAAKAQPEPLNEAQHLTAMARRLAHAADPVAYCQEVLDWTPDPWQAEALRSASKRILFNIARQSGKSTVAAARALWKADLFPGSLVLIICPTLPQAGELRRKIDAHVANMKTERPTEKESNRRTLEFANGSRIVIVAADSDSVRGYSAVALIIEDEAQSVADEVYEAMEPMLLVSRGQHILMATPAGLKGHFSKLWHEGGESWHRFEMTAWQNPRVNHAALLALREEKERMGRLWWFQQEYECSFIAAAQGLVYPYESPRNASPALDMHPRFGWQFVLGIDYGYTDSTAYVVLGWRRDDPHVYVIESFDKRGLLPTEAAEIALGLTKKYPFARMVGDAGGLGKPYVEEARRRFRLPLEMAEKNNKRGYIEIMAGDIRAGFLKVCPGNAALLKEWAELPWDEEREMPVDGLKDHLADAALYGYRATLHYLEEVRKLRPAKGSPAALKEEADAMLEDRIRDVATSGREWWDAQEGGGPWQGETAQWMN